MRLISARLATKKSEGFIQKASTGNRRNELRDEYDLAMLRGGVRGKYLKRVDSASNLAD